MWQNWFSERNSQTENKTILELLWLLLLLLILRCFLPLSLFLLLFLYFQIGCPSLASHAPIQWSFSVCRFIRRTHICMYVQCMCIVAMVCISICMLACLLACLRSFTSFEMVRCCIALEYFFTRFGPSNGIAYGDQQLSRFCARLFVMRLVCGTYFGLAVHTERSHFAMLPTY